MNNGYYTNIGIKDFSFIDRKINYQDDDFIVISNLNHITSSEETVRLDCFVIAYCTCGETQIELNGEVYKWGKGCLAMILPSTFLRRIQSSEDFTVDITVFSHSFVRNVFSFRKDLWDISMYIYRNPIRNAEHNEHLRFGLYTQLLDAKMNEEKNEYNKEIIRHLFYALFCEILHEINSWIPESGRVFKNDLKPSDYIFKKFIEKVSADDGSHRSVVYYADQLFYSPKYLSKIVRCVSGKTPLEIIHAHATELIKYKLKNSDMSIKEISNYFKFPNPSFFGKYVKTHLGMSPKKYREMRNQ